jgi:hypothetical protein
MGIAIFELMSLDFMQEQDTIFIQGQVQSTTLLVLMKRSKIPSLQVTLLDYICCAAVMM